MRRTQEIKVGNRELVVSNLDKVFFPETGFTKGEVIAYYTNVADVILPHLRDRPLTLKRYPDGTTGEHFYEKDAPSHTPSWVKRVAVPRTEGGEDINYVLCNDLPTLIWATNLGDIEKHVFLAKANDLQKPEMLVFDLDPGEPAGPMECARVALELRMVLAGLGLESFVKVSGSKGLHMSVPLNTKVTYEQTQPFAKAIAELLETKMRGEVVSEMAKHLRKGKVLIDWSQNSDFKTTVAVYAMRAKREEPFISLPITWDELTKALKREDEASLFFTPDAAIKRIKKVGDLFEPVLKLKQKLPTAFMKALATGPKPKLSTWQRHARGGDRDKSLREYAAKRDHSRTPEPAAKEPRRSKDERGPRQFVIQKHEASHLHYDFRLEMQGVLRSWAVPKGPPLNPGEPRLAMHVEDHPIEYGSFEGTIPQGNYGAGTVMLWDRGTYEEVSGNPAKAFYSGKLHLKMHGEKLNGEWVLTRDKDAEEENKWLLLKVGKPLKLAKTADDKSVVSGRTMGEIAKANDAQWESNRSRRGGKTKNVKQAKRIEAEFIEPMLCKPVQSLPEGNDWSYEIKYDGYRCIAVKAGSKVALLSRNDKSLSNQFPTVVERLKEIEGDFVLDGEVVALNEEGIPSFQLLQNRQNRSMEICLFVFDLLNKDGEVLTRLPIETRRERLKDFLKEAKGPVKLAPVIEGEPSQIIAAVEKLGLEGVVGKRNGSVYEPGERSGAWIKLRTNQRQEFVIGGFVPGSHGFDALLVGVYEGKDLQFVAKVRNGYVPRIRAEIMPKMKKLGTPDCPFVNWPEKKARRWGESLTAEKMKECTWVKPKLTCEVAFVEWTESSHLRHCTFVGMRRDKKASSVVRES